MLNMLYTTTLIARTNKLIKVEVQWHSTRKKGISYWIKSIAFEGRPPVLGDGYNYGDEAIEAIIKSHELEVVNRFSSYKTEDGNDKSDIEI